MMNTTTSSDNQTFDQLSAHYSGHNPLPLDDNGKGKGKDNSHHSSMHSESMDPSESAQTDLFLGEGDEEDGDKPKNSQEAVQEMIQGEKAEASRIQNRVLLLLATCSVLVCIAMGLGTARMEINSIEDSFQQSSEFLTTQLKLQAAQSLRAMSSLSASLTLMLDEKREMASKVTTFEIISLEEAEEKSPLFVSDPHFGTRARMVQDLLWKGGAREIAGGSSLLHRKPVIFTHPVVHTSSSSSAASADAQTVRYPVWQVAPEAGEAQIAKLDLKSIPTAANAIDYVVEHEGAVLSGVLSAKEQSFLGLLDFDDIDNEFTVDAEPMSLMVVPIFDTLSNSTSSSVVGTIIASFYWSDLLVNILPHEEWGIMVVFASSEETCVGGAESGTQSFTYKLLQNVTYLGMEDKHQAYYDESEQAATFENILDGTVTHESDGTERPYVYASDYPCTAGLEVRTYPSATYRQLHRTRTPAIVTGTLVTILVLVIILVLCYASKLDYRMSRTTEKYARTQHLINSLFPKDVQEKMFQDHDLAPKVLKGDAPLLQIQSAMKEKEANNTKSLPIAERFESATVMFADIAGFTNWSSGREPGNVFELLETIYNAFDKVAKERGIFKVETIGDCYMCVCGLPERREDHASAMCIFAQSCLRQMRKLTKELHQKLGGDTNKLALRVGLHSGDVTAGVLRGEKSRFQLFGDTVNTASRMESTGQKNRIQISKATADLLKKEDKEHWYVEREGGVEAKGKGQLHTFWLSPASMSAGTGTRSSGSGTGSYTSNNNNNNARQRRSSTASRRDYTDNTGSKSGSGSFEFDEEIGSHHSMSFHMSQTETESNV